jgi:hypothetical protein
MWQPCRYDIGMLEEPLYLPTPDEIAARCDEIRATWSPLEREKRTLATKGQRGRVDPPHWLPPVVHVESTVDQIIS